MCRWMASDDDFFVIRKFGEVAARVLLRMQDRIVQLEAKLQEQDRISVIHGLHNGTFRKEKNLSRDQIMDELTCRLSQYRMLYNNSQRSTADDFTERFALDHSQMKERTKATRSQVSNVMRWINSANKKVIEKEEQAFLYKEGDLIPVVPNVVPEARMPLRRFIDQFTILRLPRCLRIRVVRNLPGLVLYSSIHFG